jgi:hypothetical protein
MLKRGNCRSLDHAFRSIVDDLGTLDGRTTIAAFEPAKAAIVTMTVHQGSWFLGALSPRVCPEKWPLTRDMAQSSQLERHSVRMRGRSENKKRPKMALVKAVALSRVVAHWPSVPAIQASAQHVDLKRSGLAFVKGLGTSSHSYLENLDNGPTLPKDTVS